MRRLVIILCTLLVCGSFVPPIAATPASDIAPLVAVTGQTIPEHYIVSLKAGVHPRDVASGQRVVTTAEYTGPRPGFAAALDAGQLAALRRHPHVTAIEPDQVVSIATTQANPPSWGLDRVDQRTLPLSQGYSPFAAGQGVTAYIIDTGIYPDHPDFGGRASVGTTFVPTEPPVDFNGHGTHVAGTIGGERYGIAKQVSLVGVKVLNRFGSGTTSTILAGIDWVAQEHLAHPGTPALANLSISGPASLSVDSAIDALVDAGVFVVVAAGNTATDACESSPSRASKAFAVAASDIADNSASFTNTGSCVKLYAPGVDIVSDWIPVGSEIDPNFPTVTLSGTSMAAPHVMGAAVLFLSVKPQASPQEIATWLLATATPNILRGVPVGTPNKLLFSGKLALTATGATTYGDATAVLHATLKVDGANAPISGVPITFTLNSVAVCRIGATPAGLPSCPNTDSQGAARLPDVPIAALGAGKYLNVACANFAGAGDYPPTGPDCGPLTVARRILWVKPVDQTVKLKQPNPTGCTLQLANGSAFLPSDGWGSMNTSNVRCTSSRNYPSSNASETVGKTYKISATGVLSTNYDIRYQQGTLTVIQP